MPTRRSFLLTAPLAAFSAESFPQPASAEPFKLITAKQLETLTEKLDDAPGNVDLYAAPALPFTYVLTVEEKKAQKEFEWHELRDHVLQILDGECTYEVGGTPTAPHSSRPHEWNSPGATGTTTYTLREGDTLILPRNTLHKRTTHSSVTFTLLSPNTAS